MEREIRHYGRRRARAWWRLRLTRAVLACVLIAGAAIAGLPLRPAAACGAALDEGDVVALRDTPHVWVADANGVIHWGGDTRALSGHPVNWDARREVTADGLRTFPLGDPWLSAGLLKMGDPIYLVKWESDAPAPTLLHIQSIADLDLFGIDGGNYGAFVMDAPEWERRYGIATAGLAQAELAPTAAAIGYDADWSCGMNGWVGGADWTVAGGMLSNDGTVPQSIAWAPYRPPATDYAVEAVMRAHVEPDSGEGSRFGIVIRNDGTGYYGAGVSRTRAVILPRLDDNAPLGTSATPLVPDDDWHTYRVEVKGATLIRLSIDGVVVAEVNDAQFRGGREVGLYADTTRVDVQSFSVRSLGGNVYGGGGGSGGGGTGGGGSGGGSGGSGGTGGGTSGGGSEGGGAVGGPPRAPSNLRAVFVAPQSIRLTWDDNSDDESSFVLTAGWPDNLKVQWVSPNSTTLTLPDAVLSASYAFTAAACNSYGCSGRAEAQLRTPADPLA